jgi:hypothetical protein
VEVLVGVVSALEFMVYIGLAKVYLFHSISSVAYDNLGCHLGVEVVLATGLDRHFGSGYGSEQNRSQIGGLGRQLTRTVDSGTVPSTSPCPSELGGFAAGCLAGSSVH